MAEYVPRQGDFIAIAFEPQTGHEQSGRRPALVVSHDLFNQHTGLAIVCPITNTRRDYPFHVAIPAGGEVTGFVMVEQVRSIDYRARRAKRIGKAPDEVLQEALSLLDACVF
ncbi:MAG: type II toxin-antitoxin system PemK/MazF family toxin [Candidatus Bipolaricaulota bacterium]|nr:type II toxin-antitoxin system PemK/MazF family toxin [Candidatus Bipolaricaulota bacterium]